MQILSEMTVITPTVLMMISSVNGVEVMLRAS